MKKRKATIFIELCNILCFNGIPLFSGNILIKRLLFLKVNEKHRLNKSVMKERESSFVELVIQHTLFKLNGIPLLSAPPIDERTSLP